MRLTQHSTAIMAHRVVVPYGTPNLLSVQGRVFHLDIS